MKRTVARCTSRQLTVVSKSTTNNTKQSIDGVCVNNYSMLLVRVPRRGAKVNIRDKLLRNVQQYSSNHAESRLEYHTRSHTHDEQLPVRVIKTAAEN